MNQKTKTKNKTAAKKSAVSFTDNGFEDYLYWQKTDQKVFESINELLKECIRHPFSGTGKPEPLVGDLTGFWSRNIYKKNRLVYLPEDGNIYVIQCRFHYGDK
jgi:toxin YoeB